MCVPVPVHVACSTCTVLLMYKPKIQQNTCFHLFINSSRATTAVELDLMAVVLLKYLSCVLLVLCAHHNIHIHFAILLKFKMFCFNILSFGIYEYLLNHCKYSDLIIAHHTYLLIYNISHFGC